jgi:hypothetical protein
MTLTSILACALDGPLKSGRGKFQRRIIAISAPNTTINERAFVFGGRTSMVLMVAQCNRDADLAPVGHEQG